MVASFYLLHTFYLRRQSLSSEKKSRADLIRSQIEIEEQTLQKISCEIHDNIALTLSLSKIYLHDIDLSDHTDAHDKINLSICLIKKTMDDLNNLSRSLHPDSIRKFGLTASVEQLVTDVSRTELFSITLNLKGNGRLPVNDEFIVYRMMQEVLNNIIRHANATDVIVWMEFEKTNLRIRICDNGTGFNPDDTNISGTGLSNLKKRAQVINALLSIESVLNVGTTVIIVVPLSNNL